MTHGKPGLVMDRLILSLMNTSRERPDPLQSPVGAARWWSSVQDCLSPLALRPSEKPRFDPGLADRLRLLRGHIGEALDHSGYLSVEFTGTAETDGVLLPVVWAALAILGSSRAARFRRCAARDCSLRFLDRTKNGSRRWCSLRCMERARVPRRRTIAA